jgi:hypothetical protein
MAPDVFSGGCFCRAVRFEVSAPTKWCAHCHCDSCRRAAGAAFVTWVGVPDPQFRLLSEERSVRRFNTSPGVIRTYCAECGSHLFFLSDRRHDETHVVCAAFDGEIDREPQVHVYWDEHIPWARVGDHLPRLGGVSGEEPL